MVREHFSMIPLSICSSIILLASNTQNSMWSLIYIKENAVLQQCLPEGFPTATKYRSSVVLRAEVLPERVTIALPVAVRTKLRSLEIELDGGSRTKAMT